MSHDINKIKQLLNEIEIILQQEGGGNFLAGIRSCLQEADHKNGITDIQSIYTHMNRVGYGGFSDFYIARDDFDEQVRLNADFDRIKKELWSALKP